MTKLFTAVLILIATSQSYSMDLNDFSTKNIVRSKLWYEGIQFSSSKNQVYENVDLIEEISIPLNLLEQELL